MLVSMFGFDGDGRQEARTGSFYYLNVRCITNMKIIVNVCIHYYKVRFLHRSKVAFYIGGQPM